MYSYSFVVIGWHYFVRRLCIWEQSIWTRRQFPFSQWPLSNLHMSGMKRVKLMSLLKVTGYTEYMYKTVVTVLVWSHWYFFWEIQWDSGCAITVPTQMTRYLMCMCVINIIKMCLCDTLRINLYYLSCRISLFCGILCFSSGLFCFCFFNIYHLNFCCCWCICWFWFSQYYSLHIAPFESCSLWVCVSELIHLLSFLFNVVSYQVFGVFPGVPTSRDDYCNYVQLFLIPFSVLTSAITF